MASSGMLRRVALVSTDVSEESSASIIRVTRIDEVETTLAVTSNQHQLQRKFIDSCHPADGGAKFLSNVATRRNIPEDDILHIFILSHYTLKVSSVF
jgi:hypothetical protein